MVKHFSGLIGLFFFGSFSYSKNNTSSCQPRVLIALVFLVMVVVGLSIALGVVSTRDDSSDPDPMASPNTSNDGKVISEELVMSVYSNQSNILVNVTDLSHTHSRFSLEYSKHNYFCHYLYDIWDIT